MYDAEHILVRYPVAVDEIDDVLGMMLLIELEGGVSNLIVVIAPVVVTCVVVVVRKMCGNLFEGTSHMCTSWGLASVQLVPSI
jgi:hypothetical protein